MKERKDSEDQLERIERELIPVVQDAIFQKPFDNITGFLTADRGYRSIERQSKYYGIVEKRHPCGC